VVFGTAAAITTISQRRVIACVHVLPSKIGPIPLHAARHVVGITYARSFRWLAVCRTSLSGPLWQVTKRPTECRAASSATSPTPNPWGDENLRERSPNGHPTEQDAADRQLRNNTKVHRHRTTVAIYPTTPPRLPISTRVNGDRELCGPRTRAK